MALGTMMKASGGIAAMAAALAMLATPASAQERGQGLGGRDGGAWSQGGRGNGGEGRSFRGDGQSAAQPQSAGQEQPQRTWNRDGGQRRREGAAARVAPAPQPAQAQQAQAERRDWSGNRQAQTQGQARPQWQGRAESRDNAGRNDRNRNDNRWRGNDASRGNDARRGNDTPGWRGDRGANYAGNYANNRNGNWNRDWRRDNRYDWRGYRSSNRNTYRLGAYYAPYRNYSYRRLNSGFRLDALFFGSRYWINDPWQYRLPPADGPYRWVRYYDDAMLVDTYSGEVVDVIYDFFW
jgi:hypothetical protein